MRGDLLTRRLRYDAEVRRGKSRLIALAILGGCAASPAAAQPTPDEASPLKGIAFSALTILATDYMNRGISQTDQHAAIQGYLEATHGILYLGLWGSNVDFGLAPNRAGNLEQVANLELGFSSGIRPKWQGISFDLGIYYYVYPGQLSTADLDYVEFDASASYAVTDKLTLRLLSWWSPDESDTQGGLDGLELTASYALKQIWHFRPTVSAVFGRQWSLGATTPTKPTIIGTRDSRLRRARSRLSPSTCAIGTPIFPAARRLSSFNATRGSSDR